MIRAEFYDSGRPLVILERDASTNAGAWSRLQEAFIRGVVGGSERRIDVRPDVFLAELQALREIRQVYGEDLDLGVHLKTRLRTLAEDRNARESRLSRMPADPALLQQQLRASGFLRNLKPFQLRNLGSILSLPHGADFSVPGAGKTTVALANFCLNRQAGHVRCALVVAPIAAFGAWKEDAAACFSTPLNVVVHEGTDSLIPERRRSAADKLQSTSIGLRSDSQFRRKPTYADIPGRSPSREARIAGRAWTSRSGLGLRGATPRRSNRHARPPRRT